MQVGCYTTSVTSNASLHERVTMDDHGEQSDEANTSSTEEQIATLEPSNKARQGLKEKFKRSTVDSLVSATETLRETAGDSHQDEFQLFGKIIGTQLSQLPLEDAIELQIEFQNMIGQRRLAIIRRNNTSTTRDRERMDSQEHEGTAEVTVKEEKAEDGDTAAVFPEYDISVHEADIKQECARDASTDSRHLGDTTDPNKQIFHSPTYKLQCYMPFGCQ